MSVHWHDFPIGYFPPTTTPSCTFVTLWQLFDSIWLFGARQSNKQASDQANERRKSERTDGPSDNGSCWQNRVADSGRAWRGTVIWVSKIYKWKMWSLAAPAQDTAQGSEGQRGNTHINLILWQTKWTNIQLKMYYFKIVFFSIWFYLQSRLMPAERHFLKRQYWQRFRFKRITRHLPSRRQRYSICFCMLRRKKPCKMNSKWKLI